MIRKLTTKKSQNPGSEKRFLAWAINCTILTCMPYCGGLRTVAYDTLESLSY